MSKPRYDEPGFDSEDFAWSTLGLVLEHQEHHNDRWVETVAGLVCPADDVLVVPSVAFLRAGGAWPPD
jgi:hypothetical protein